MVPAAKFIAIGVAIASLGQVALAIGIIFASLMLAAAKTPWMAPMLTGQAFFGFALCEAMALLILLIVVILLFL